MLNVLLLCVGKLREPYLRDACAEYEKRLSRFMNLTVCEADEQREPDKPAPALLEKLVAREGEALLSRVRPDDHVVALALDGWRPDSPALADALTRWSLGGKRLVFVVGGSQGLAPRVLERADTRLSFSALTFPHTLFRAMLLEQLYRAAKIAAGEKYHK